MATATQTAAEIQRLVWLFLPSCKDRETLLALDTMAAEPNQWPEGHELFQRIRSKTLAAQRVDDRLSNTQYCFEEVCAKTLYNLSGFPAPFDKDSRDKIFPNALALAQALSIPDPDSAVGLGA
ncbi:hypothetical protein [Xanthomonas campestris]|uniref:hypothetical protein n=1 Tax=Xanthomonas campestris TaxID=339 RepID=UPI000E0FCDEA|nr:hypothetical protein [Xanthomonas campestris]